MLKKSIKLNNTNINYTLRVNKKLKKIRLIVHAGGNISVSCPRFVPQFFVNRFLFSKSDWILEKVEYFSKIKPIKKIKEQREDYLKYKDKALSLAKERLEYFNKIYNFKYNNITIRNQKTRWGSCSKKGNLNFNYKIINLSEEQADYIIVHELCHLKEFNHKTNFWKLVSVTIPDYKRIRQELKAINIK